MSQRAPLPGSVFRFGTEVDEVLNPGNAKTLTRIEPVRGLRPQPSGRTRRSGCAAAEPYPPSRHAKDTQSLNLISTML
jgi:hypothetical protein